MTVLILKEDTPGTPVHVNATFFIDSIAIVSAVGQFHAGRMNSYLGFITRILQELVVKKVTK